MGARLNLSEQAYQKRLAWQRMRAQALFRGEPFELSLAEFYQIWTDELWGQRGMAVDQLVLSRRNRQLPWSQDNCEIITRQQQFNITGDATRGQKRRPYRPRQSKK